MAPMERLLILLLLPVSASQANVPRLTIRALKGSCVVIPCVFSNPEPRKPLTLLDMAWYRQPGPLTVYSGKGDNLVFPAYRGRTAFVGDLGKDNCSLQINNVNAQDAAVYYPWIDPVTIVYEQYTVEVSDPPDEPSLSAPGEMTEGIPGRISCSTVHTCPPHPPSLTWNVDWGNASVHHEELVGGKWKTVSELYYTPRSGDNSTSLQCTAIYTDSVTSKKAITLQIRYPPKNTRTAVKGDAELREGDNVTLVCSADGNPAVSYYSWTEGQPESDDLGNGQEKTLENITWDSGPYYCTAKNEVGEGKSAPLRLNITYAPKRTRVDGDPNPVEGTSLILTCMTNSSNPSATHFSWYMDGILIHNHSGSQLHLQAVTANHSGNYHCMAHNTLGNSSSPTVIVNVFYAPKGTQVVGPEKSPHNGDDMTFECQTDSSNPAVGHYSWYKDGDLLENQTEKTLNIEIVAQTYSGQYYCVAHNAVGGSPSENITVAMMASQAHPANKSFAVLGGTIAFLLLLLLALFLFLWSSRKKKMEAAGQKQPAPSKVPEDVVYVTIDHSKRRGTRRRSVPSDDYVTYAAVKSHSENEAVPDVMYAEVKKPNRSLESKPKENEVIYATDLKFQHRTPNGQESHSADNVEYASVKR